MNNFTARTFASDAPTKRVLIIEDDACLRTVLLAVLRKIDNAIECECSTEGEEALGLLSTKKFDLIVCDHQLESKTTGMDIWRAIEGIYPRTSFLMMSAMGIEKFIEMSSGFAVPPLYLPKPFKIQECQMYFQTLLKGVSHV